MMRNIYLAGVLLFVGGCGGTPQIAMAPAIEQAPQNELPPPVNMGPDGKFIYKLGPLDTISIEIDGMPDMVRQVVVDGQGMIAYPMAGSVLAAGLTTTQLARALETRLREAHFLDPKVSVNFVTPVSNVLTIEGEVGAPGLYPIYRDITLMQAVALAEGEGDYARTSAVLVFRDVGESQFVGLYDLGAIRYGNYPDPKVYPNDKIVVSVSETRRLLQQFQPFWSLVNTPLILLLRR